MKFVATFSTTGTIWIVTDKHYMLTNFWPRAMWYVWPLSVALANLSNGLISSPNSESVSSLTPWSSRTCLSNSSLGSYSYPHNYPTGIEFVLSTVTSTEQDNGQSKGALILSIISFSNFFSVDTGYPKKTAFTSIIKQKFLSLSVPSSTGKEVQAAQSDSDI